MVKRLLGWAIPTLALAVLVGQAGAQSTQQTDAWPYFEMSRAGDIEQILPLRERARVYNEILEWRLDNILPA